MVTASTPNTFKRLVFKNFIADTPFDRLTHLPRYLKAVLVRLDKLKVDLESSEMALHEYKMDKNILSVAFDDQTNMLRGQMAQISTRVRAAATA